MDPDETSQLLSEDGHSSARVSFNEEPSMYGATDQTTDSTVGSPESIELNLPSPSPSQDHDFQTPTAGSEGDSLSFQTASEEVAPNTAGQ